MRKAMALIGCIVVSACSDAHVPCTMEDLLRDTMLSPSPEAAVLSEETLVEWRRASAEDRFALAVVLTSRAKESQGFELDPNTLSEFLADAAMTMHMLDQMADEVSLDTADAFTVREVAALQWAVVVSQREARESAPTP